MADNIEWASPEITECWNFYGRLYRTKKKAEIERKRWLNIKEKYAGSNSYWANREIPPVRHIKWEWDNAE